MVQGQGIIRCSLECLSNADHDCDAINYADFNCKIGKIDNSIKSGTEAMKVWRRRGEEGYVILFSPRTWRSISLKIVLVLVFVLVLVVLVANDKISAISYFIHEKVQMAHLRM